MNRPSSRERRTAVTAAFLVLGVSIGAGIFKLHETSIAITALVLLVGAVLVLYADFITLNVGPRGVTAERDREAAEVTRDLEEATKQDVAAVARPPTHTVVTAADQLDTFAEQADVEDSEATRRAEEQRRRRAIENVMTAAAHWGYQMAHLGFETPPTPMIEWTDKGEPVIKYGTGTGGTAAGVGRASGRLVGHRGRGPIDEVGGHDQVSR